MSDLGRELLTEVAQAGWQLQRRGDGQYMAVRTNGTEHEYEFARSERDLLKALIRRSERK